MITFILWKWKQIHFRETYTAAHVHAMLEMLGRHCTKPHRVICITDDPTGLDCLTFPIWDDYREMRNASGGHLPSCYRRLKIFDGQTTDAIGIGRGEKIVSIDLDAVIVSPSFSNLFDRPERFVGWAVPGHRHLRVFNGSMFMFYAGDMEFLWRDFDPKFSPDKAIKAGYMGSDQGWLSQQLINRPDVGGWTAQKDGVRSYQRDVRVPRIFTTANTSVVFFAGRRKPWHADVQREAKWIGRHIVYEDQKEKLPCNSTTISPSSVQPV